ncbi:restriction endonuclease subunit S [Phyllobacterium ifriqiyense]|uniref:restriction endonuclease subunit S n=1 Tax=Phyllobacterium ifriqiyense TaxID=314238 RepID=UPI00339623FA
MTIGTFPLDKIGRLVAQVATWNPKRDASGQLIRYVDLGSVDNETKRIAGYQEILADEAPSRARQLVKAGDILVSTVRPNLNGVARVPVELDGITVSTGYCVLRPDNHNLISEYLFHWVKSPEFIADMTKKATGQSYPAVSNRIVGESEIPLPSIEEQRQIAAALDQADELQSFRRETVELAEKVTQAIFLEMFGDWSRPGHNAKLIRLGDHLDFLTSGSRGWATYYRNEGDLFLRIQNLGSDKLILQDTAYVDAPQSAEAKRTCVQPGDVLMSITADLGRTAVIPNDFRRAYINQHLSILRSSRLEPRFLSAALASPAGQRAIQGKNREGVKAGLNFDDIRSLEIPDVPGEKQKLFAQRAAAVDILNQRYMGAQTHLSSLYASLQHRAFRGEL